MLILLKELDFIALIVEAPKNKKNAKFGNPALLFFFILNMRFSIPICPFFMK